MTTVDFILPRKNFNIQVQESFSGGITGIFGPSGSGKTSLLHSISGITRPASGSITIEGRVVFDAKKKIHLSPEKRNIGYVFQEGRLFPHLNVERNLIYGLKKHRKSKIPLSDVVNLLNLKHLLKNKPSQISGGERQRTALGRALLSSPDILLLDEPFSAVDSSLRNQIIPFIVHIHYKVNIPILVVSHDLPDILKLTNRLLVIRDGQSLGHGEYYDLLKNHKTATIFRNGALINLDEMMVSANTEESGLNRLEYLKRNHRVCGAKGSRTPDLLTASQAL